MSGRDSGIEYELKDLSLLTYKFMTLTIGQTGTALKEKSRWGLAPQRGQHRPGHETRRQIRSNPETRGVTGLQVQVRGEGRSEV